MYAQVCTRSYIAFIVGNAMLGRYLSNPRMDHWRATKGVFRYLKRTKYYSSHTRGQIRLRSLGIRILTLLDAKIVGDPHRATFIC